MKIKDRLSEILTGKKVNCCFKCQNFKIGNDSLDFTGSFGDCIKLNENVFGHQYCEEFIPANPFNKDQNFYIALFTNDQKFYYIKNIKPVDFEQFNFGKGDEDEQINVYFEIPELNLDSIQCSVMAIKNKTPNSIMICDYVISTEDNEDELKKILISYILDSLKLRFDYLNTELEKIKSEYLNYEKYLKKGN